MLVVGLARVHDGEVAVVDLETHTRHPIARGNDAAWLAGGARVAVSHLEGGYDVVDAATGVVLRTTPTAQRIDRLWSDGDRRVIWWAARELVEQIGDDPPRVIAPGVTGVYPDRDLAWTVYTDAAGAHLLAPDGTQDIPGDISVASVDASQRRVAVANTREVVEYVRDDGKLREVQRLSGSLGIISVNLTPRGVAVVTSTGLRTVSGGQTLHTAEVAAVATVALPDGTAFVERDGTIRIDDVVGTRTIPGILPVEVGRAEATRDGRWFVEASAGGDLLAWDLSRIRPQIIDRGSYEQLLRLTSTTMWTLDRSIVYRRDPPTAAPRAVAEIDPGMEAAVSEDGRWIYGIDEMRRVVLIIDVANGKRERIDDALAAMIDPHTLAVAAGGRVERWRFTDHLAKQAVGSAPSAIAIHANGEHIALQTTDTELFVDGARRHCGPIRRFAVTSSGALYVLSGDKLLDCTGDAQVEVTLPSIPRWLWASGDEAIAILTEGTLAVIDARGPRYYATRLTPNMVVAQPERLVAGIDGDFAIGIVDLDTGGRWSLRIDRRIPLDHADVTGGRIMGVPMQVTRERRGFFLIWPEPPPRDETELRAWIAGGTNAYLVPNGDTIGWR